MMTMDEVIQRLKAAPNRSAVAKAADVPYGYVNKLVYGEITNPGVKYIEKLVVYFERQGQ